MAEQISSIASEFPKISQPEVRPSAETGNTSGGGNAPENKAPAIPANSGDATLAQEEPRIKQTSLDKVVGVEPSQPTVLNGSAQVSSTQEDSLLKRLSNK